MNDEYRELFVMYGNEDEHSKLILDLKQPDDTRGAYVDNPYPVDGKKIWNVDKCKDIPWEYDGYVGVPITIMEKIKRDVFEIIDANTDFCDLYRINGKKSYKRFIIKIKKAAPLYEWYDEENKIKYVGTKEDLILMFENEKRPKPNYKLTEEQKNYLRLLEQAACYDGRDEEYRRHIEWYNTEDPLTEEDNIPFEEFIKKYTATDEAKLKALRENFKFWRLRDEYEKIEGIKILILDDYGMVRC